MTKSFPGPRLDRHRFESLCSGLNKKPAEVFELFDGHKTALMINEQVPLGTAVNKSIEMVAGLAQMPVEEARQLYNTFL